MRGGLLKHGESHEDADLGIEQRHHERRQWNLAVSYPFFDSNGQEVLKNRRRTVDRRLSFMEIQQPVTLELRYGNQEIEMISGNLKIGRHSSNDIVINHPLVSRYHAVILAVSGGFMLMDTSRNGTFIRLGDSNEDIHVYAGEFILKGHGVIRLGRSTVAPGKDDLLQFILH